MSFQRELFTIFFTHIGSTGRRNGSKSMDVCQLPHDACRYQGMNACHSLRKAMTGGDEEEKNQRIGGEIQRIEERT